MTKIKLTQGKYAIVDDYDYIMLMQYKWHLTKKCYARTNVKQKKGKYKGILMHRLILGLTNPKKQTISMVIN